MVFLPASRRACTVTSAANTRRRLGKVDGSERKGAVMNFDTESIDGYAIPVDPMDLLQCDSCQ
jgi:hypothetical protein